jgi:MATE family multidrug resistance protein
MSGNSGRIAALAWPILIGQLAVIANSVLDTAMTSRYSATDLAALALGTSIYISIFVGLNGVLQALSPTIAHLFGAQRLDEIGVEVKQGVWLAWFLSCIGCLILAFPQPLLSLAHASPQLTDKATHILRIFALVLPATLGMRIYSALNHALARPKMVMALQLCGLLLKIPLNTLFIFGGLGLPAFGGVGCAIASALIAWLMLVIALTILCNAPFYQSFGLFGSGFIAPRWNSLQPLLKLGIPTGLSYLIEVSSYAFMALFIARLGETAVAGHQIVANFGTVLYMLPLSIASATATLVAQALGAREPDLARRIGYAGIRMAAVISCTIGIAIWLTRGAIVRAYTPDAAIAAAALPLFLFIAVYQLFDALQVTTGFVLRAYKIAVIPTLMYALALWGVGLGGGYMLGLDPFGWNLRLPHGTAGFWLANSVSLALVACGLLWYLRRIQGLK